MPSARTMTMIADVALCRAKYRNAKRRSDARLITASRRLQDRCERAGKALPAIALFGELLSSCGGERVDLCAAPLWRLLPVGLDEAALLEAIQRGGERTGVHLQYVARDGLDPETQVVTVGRLSPEELEYNQVERSLQERRG